METYDEIFAIYLNRELDKINPIMRFTKKKGIIFLWIIGAFCFITYVLIAFLTDSVKTGTVVIDSASGGRYESMPIAYYNTTICALLIISALVVVVFAGWLVLGQVYERRAFRVATKSAQQDWNTIKLREREAREIEKLQRDFFELI